MVSSSTAAITFADAETIMRMSAEQAAPIGTEAEAVTLQGAVFTQTAQTLSSEQTARFFELVGLTADQPTLDFLSNILESLVKAPTQEAPGISSKEAETIMAALAAEARLKEIDRKHAEEAPAAEAQPGSAVETAPAEATSETKASE